MTSTADEIIQQALGAQAKWEVMLSDLERQIMRPGLADSTKRELISQRLNYANSESRLPTLLSLMNERTSPAIFWTVFHEHWDCCDYTWEYRSRLMQVLRCQTKRRHASDFMSEECRKLFCELSQLVTCYRGCSRSRIRGVSWTVNRRVAEDFARGHRGIRVPEPVVVMAVVPKEAIFTVATEREESEIILDPRRLRNLVINPYLHSEIAT